MFESFIIKSFVMVLFLSGVPLLATSVTGLLVSIFQAATQIQEQSLTYLIKFLTLAGILALMANLFSAQMITFFQEYLTSLEFFGRGKW